MDKTVSDILLLVTDMHKTDSDTTTETDKSKLVLDNCRWASGKRSMETGTNNTESDNLDSETDIDSNSATGKLHQV